MRQSVTRAGVKALALVLAFAGPVFAQSDEPAKPPIPERRAVMMDGTDMPGSDIGQHFDVTLGACTAICLSDTACTAFTYNQNTRACFPKAGAPPVAPYLGAMSARIVPASASAIKTAGRRAALAPFLSLGDLDAAQTQAREAALNWLPLLEPDVRAAAREALQMGQTSRAIRLMGTVVAESDRADDWLELAGILQRNAPQDSATANAAINAYLRAEQDDTAGKALGILASVWDSARGRDSLQALRAAVELSADAALSSALQRAEERYGMRVLEHAVDADAARPSLCVTFSYQLSDAVDYAPYVRLPEGDLTVEQNADKLCIAGLSHGQRAQLTLRAGLPSVEGEKLARDVTVEGYIRDRSAAISFPSRAYVLPARGDLGLELVSINADTVDLRLMRVSDRNLLQSMRNDLFARPLDRWAAQWLNDEMATEIWKGQADLVGAGDASRLNQEVRTRLGIPEAAGPLEPGIYVLQVSLPSVEDQGDDYYYDYDASAVAAQWFVVSDFGVSSLWGADGVTVVVRSLNTAAAVEGVEVALVSRANAVLDRVLTDAEGVARFDAALTRGNGGDAPAVVTVTDWQGEGVDRAPRDMAFLSLMEAEFDLSDRGVAGMAAPGPVDLFMATDRGVYRAGETVHVTAMARDSAARAVKDLPMTAIFTRPDGVEAMRLRLDPDAAGGYVFDLPIDGGAPRGTWRLEMRASDKGPPLAMTRLLVEDFLPERIDFTIGLPEGVLAAGETVPLALDVNWLFGAPAADLPIEAWLRDAPARTLPGFDGYAFGLPDGSPEQRPLTEGRTGEDGRFAFDFDMPSRPDLREVTVSVQVSEGAGRPVERKETRTAAPATPVIGIKMLADGNTVSEGTEARFEVIALDPDLQRIDMPLRWVLTRLDTDYVWYRAGDRWNWETVVHRKRVTSGEVSTGADLPGAVAIAQPWGQYELRVEPADPAQTGQGTAAVTYWSGWAMSSAGTETPDRLSVRLDRENYRAGETARLTIETEAAGVAIVSVLTNRVVDLKTVALEAGSNEVSLPVTDEWGAGAYVTASALRPLEGDLSQTNRDPARRLGLVYAPVDPGARKLSAEIEVAAESRPRGTLPVTLRLDNVPAGETAYATIAVVDQGILNLTAFKTPDPAGYYFGQHRLGVGLRDLYGRLILPTGAADGTLREGGDSQSGLDMSAPPPTEVLMSWFSGPLNVGEDGTARVEVPIPDFNGEVRVMAVVWTETALGGAEARALIRDPVVMVVTAPQFLAPGDRSQLSLSLTQTEGAGESALSVEAGPDRLAVDSTGLPASVTLGEGETRKLTLPVSVPADAPLGVARLTLSLTAPDGALLTKDIAIPIIDGSPEIMRRTRLTIPAGGSVTVDDTLTRDMRAVSRMVVGAGPLAGLDLAGVLGGLARYPYGCSEQLASVAMPLIYLPKLSQLVAPDREVDRPDRGGDPTEQVKYALTRILSRQDASGGFGMWSPDDGNIWLNAYITDFLSRARANGYQVPESAWQSALENLRSQVNYAVNPASGETYENAALAYAALVLARERAASIGDLRYYVDTAADKFNTPLSAAQLGAALAALGDTARADRMFKLALEQLREADRNDLSYRADYGSYLRDRAGVLAVAAEAGYTNPALSAQTRRLADQIERRHEVGSGLSTQEASWVVQVAHGLSAHPPQLEVDGRAISEPIISLPTVSGTRLHNGSDAPMDVTLTAFGHPRSHEPAGGRGYTITRAYYDMEGAAIDPSRVDIGTRMAVVITVNPLSRAGYDGGRLIIDDPLPAGFEIDNPNLISTGDVSGLTFLGDSADTDMSQFRQDRFIASLTWRQTAPFQLIYVVRAVHAGQFNHPPALVEDMYRPEFRAWTDGGTVSVTQ